MSGFFGGGAVNKVMYGSSTIKQIYKGSNLIYTQPEDDNYLLLGFTAGEANTEFSFIVHGITNDLIIEDDTGVIQNIAAGTTKLSFTFPDTNEHVVKISPSDDTIWGWGRALQFGDETPSLAGGARNYYLTSLKSNLPEKMICSERGVAVGPSALFAYAYRFKRIDAGLYVLPKNITTVGDGFCQYMFYEVSALEDLGGFQLPQNITSVGSNFCRYTFHYSIKLTSGAAQVFGNLKLENVTDNAFYGMFLGCSGLTDEINTTTIPQLAVIPDYDTNCFAGCTSATIGSDVNEYWY